MSFTWRIVFTVLTLLTVLFCAFISVVGFVSHWPFMAIVVCLMLTAAFGFFSYHDFAGFWLPYFQGKVDSNGNPKAPPSA